MHIFLFYPSVTLRCLIYYYYYNIYFSITFRISVVFILYIYIIVKLEFLVSQFFVFYTKNYF